MSNLLPIEQQFEAAMMSIYTRALEEANYRASVFLNMLNRHGGHETARRLIHSATISPGYTALWGRERLDLTMEAMIIENPIWHPLFTEEELNICAKRLREYHYEPQTNE